MNARTTDSPAADAVATRWISLRSACEILGVNESTARRWADAGEVRCFRTPGGHRRFAEADLYAMTEGRRQGNELGAAAVTHVRRQLHSGSGDAGWYDDIGQAERDALRQLGRRLVELAGDYIARRRGSPRAAIEREIDAIGRDYGSLLRGRSTPLAQAVQAFIFFRHSLDETAKRLAERDRLDGADVARAREAIAGLADRVLLGVAAAYDER